MKRKNRKGEQEVAEKTMFLGDNVCLIAKTKTDMFSMDQFA